MVLGGVRATAGGYDVEPWYSRPGNTLYISVPDLRWQGTASGAYSARAGSRTILVLLTIPGGKGVNFLLLVVVRRYSCIALGSIELYPLYRR